jgi:carboxymethylenebutenolidase
MRVDATVPLAEGDQLKAVLARPDGEPPPGGWPGVVVIHDVFGLTPEVLDAADRFGREGYVAAVPDLFGHGTRVACVARAVLDSAVGRPGSLVDDVEATRAWLGSQSDVDASRLAVVGFCMGGGFALLHAASAPAGVRAAAVNYGAVPSDPEALRNVCPVVASYGARDLAYASHAKRLEKHLSSLGVAHDVKTYPRAGHGFMTDGDHPLGKLFFLPLRLGYEPGSAEDAWERLFAFFDEHVRAPQSPNGEAVRPQ